ncbi:E3 ubiquitin-protein ligase HUL5 [Nakaseomyces bracarensis]|uniref:HECT-type E3 ubiquitin transferase n=1 Tax=Nakaseomyces bracarensis TaxID=273131 RepID=A0ABR4NZU4_9SACH
MLNFTGQTRRRNVNLGRKQQTTKKDVLLRAQQERERRAEDRRQESATVVIQNNIRRFASCRKLVVNLLATGYPNVKYLIPVFGATLLRLIDIESFIKITKLSAEYLQSMKSPLGNYRILDIVGYLSESETMVNALRCLNLDIPLNIALILNLRKVVSELIEPLSQSVLQMVIDLLNFWRTSAENEYQSLFELCDSECRNFNEVLKTYVILGSNNLLPQSIVEGNSVLLENISYVYSKLKHEHPNVNDIMIQCVTNIKYVPVSRNMQEFVTEIYQRDFIYSYLDSIDVEKDPGSELMNFIDNAPSEAEKDSVYVSLLSKKDFIDHLFNMFLPVSNEISSFWDDETKFPAFKLLCRLIKVNLWLSTDHELQTDSTKITMQNLVHFTNTVKDHVFRDLWYAPLGSKLLFTDETLPLLRLIYNRDSRMRFCSSDQKNDEEYWTSRDPEFLKITIYKQIQEYEDHYRLYKDYQEETHDIDDESNDDKEIDEMRNMKYKYLNNMEVKPSNVRQFRKLRILLEAPFYVPFEQRVEIFYTLIELDKRRLNLDDESSAILDMLMPMTANNSRRQAANISRENILEDAYNSFNVVGERFKAKLSVTFTNEFGPEAGIDGGGITKEFLTSVSEEAIKSEKYSLFQTNDKYELYPSTQINPTKLKYLYFLGKIVGKCIYDRVLIDVQFADFFLKKLLNYSSHYTSLFDDLQSLDSSLYQNLVKLLTMEAEELEAIDLRFELTDTSSGQNKTIELVPNGSNIKVKKENVLKYLVLIADFKLNKTLFKQTSAFHRGLSVMIAPHWMELFNSGELQMLISGGGKDVDLTDLKNNTEYGGFFPDDPTITYFWEILEEFEPEQRLSFLKFVTSVPQAPLQGFATLEPRFGIRNTGSDITRLPTASTCVNLLKLPDYKTKELLRQKLLYAINAGAGFDLS